MINTPKGNAVIERFFRTLKQECVWINQFENFDQAKPIVEAWVHYNISTSPLAAHAERTIRHSVVGQKNSLQSRRGLGWGHEDGSRRVETSLKCEKSPGGYDDVIARVWLQAYRIQTATPDAREFFALYQPRRHQCR